MPLGTKLLQQHNTQSNNHRILSMLPQTKNTAKSKKRAQFVRDRFYIV